LDEAFDSVCVVVVVVVTAAAAAAAAVAIVADTGITGFESNGSVVIVAAMGSDSVATAAVEAVAEERKAPCSATELNIILFFSLLESSDIFTMELASMPLPLLLSVVLFFRLTVVDKGELDGDFFLLLFLVLLLLLLLLLLL